jgi:hypothetical protein
MIWTCSEAYSKHAELKYGTIFEDNHMEDQEGDVRKRVPAKL